jgi:hypothetical protein
MRQIPDYSPTMKPEFPNSRQSRIMQIRPRCSLSDERDDFLIRSAVRTFT